MSQADIQKLIHNVVKTTGPGVRIFDKLAKDCSYREEDPPFGMMCKKHDDGELWNCDIRTCPL